LLEILTVLKLGGAEITIQMVVVMKMGNYVERADASGVAGPPTSMTAQSNGEGPQETFGDTVRNLLPRVVFLYNTIPLL
jgi:hypothetical protein